MKFERDWIELEPAIQEILLAETLAHVTERERMEASFETFCRAAWHVIEPGKPLVWSWFLSTLCRELEAFRRREFTRLIFNVPFRTGKSNFTSVLYPAWVWATDPQHQFLSTSHNANLATRDAVKTRRLIESDWFRSYWGSRVKMRADQNEKTKYENTENGVRESQGITAGVTGKSGDTILIDDPHDAEQAQSDIERQNVLDAYDQKISTRLNNPVEGGIVLIMQRLHQRDLAGHLLASEGETWRHVCLPMEYDPDHPHQYEHDRRSDKGELLFPERFPADWVKAMRLRLGPYGSSGQLQQNPTPAGENILPRAMWQRWQDGKPIPECELIIQSYDCAFTAEAIKQNSRTARTTWGIFRHPTTGYLSMILLEAWAGQIPYDTLRKNAKEQYLARRPDFLLVEKKSAGEILIQDMKRAGIPVRAYEPRGDKVSRAYRAQPMMFSGLIWAPDRRWADDVIAECDAFPNGEHDDYVDTCTQAWNLARHMGEIPTGDDDERNSERYKPVGPAYG